MSRSSKSSSQASLRDRKRAAAEESLLDAAEAEFADAGGLDAASMQAIALRAGVSVGTLYNYFADKDALVLALMVERRRRLSAELDLVLANEHDFEHAVRALIRALFRWFDEHRAYLRISLQHAEAVHRRKSAGSLLQERMQKLIDQAVKAGAIDAARAAIAVPAMTGIVKGILLDRVDSKDSFVDVVDVTVDVILRGLRP